MGVCASAPVPKAATKPALAGPSASAVNTSTVEIVAVVVSILYVFSRYACFFLSALVTIAVVQAPIILMAQGGTLEAYQTISASVGDWSTPQARFFFACSTFGAALNVMSLQTFFLTPPTPWSPPSTNGVGSGAAPTPLLWPLSFQGSLRFWWLALQSFGLYLLASVSYTPPTAPGSAIQNGIHNTGAAILFLVSYVVENAVLSTFPLHMFVGRRVFTALGSAFAVVFIVTQNVFKCTGLMPPDVCHPPWGVVSYVTEMGMCLSLAAILFFTALGAVSKAPQMQLVQQQLVTSNPQATRGAELL